MARRKIVVDGEVWHFTVGTSAVRLTPPDGFSFAKTIPEVTGLTWEQLERGRWKQTSDGMVTPAHIAQYIQTQGRQIAEQRAFKRGRKS